MTITIESTTLLVRADGVECRVWEGQTASGIKVQCLIARIAAHKDSDLTQFEAELRENRTPVEERAFPLRMLL